MVLGVMAVFSVKFQLFFPAALRFFQSGLHRAGHSVGIENDFSLGVAGGAANRLNQ